MHTDRTYLVMDFSLEKQQVAMDESTVVNSIEESNIADKSTFAVPDTPYNQPPQLPLAKQRYILGSHHQA